MDGLQRAPVADMLQPEMRELQPAALASFAETFADLALTRARSAPQPDTSDGSSISPSPSVSPAK